MHSTGVALFWQNEVNLLRHSSAIIRRVSNKHV